MIKFFIDAYADMFGEELEKCGLYLAPSKIKKCRSYIDFQGYKKETQSEIADNISKGKYSIVPLTYEEWFEFFKTEIENGNDIVFFSVSLKLMADKGKALKKVFADLNKKYPKSTAILVDTQTISRGTSEIANLTYIVYKKENNLDDALDYAESLIGRFVSVIALEGTEGLKKSERFAKLLETFVGASLNLKPIISLDTEGKFKILDKTKTFKSAVSRLYSNVKENGQNIADYTFSIVYFNAQAEAKSLYKKFREVVNESEIRLVPMSLNNAILLGEKCVALTFHSKYNK